MAGYAQTRRLRGNGGRHLEQQRIRTLSEAHQQNLFACLGLLQHGNQQHQRMRSTGVAQIGMQGIADGRISNSGRLGDGYDVAEVAGAL